MVEGFHNSPKTKSPGREGGILPAAALALGIMSAAASASAESRGSHHTPADIPFGIGIEPEARGGSASKVSPATLTYGDLVDAIEKPIKDLKQLEISFSRSKTELDKTPRFIDTLRADANPNLFFRDNSTHVDAVCGQGFQASNSDVAVIEKLSQLWQEVQSFQIKSSLEGSYPMDLKRVEGVADAMKLLVKKYNQRNTK